MTDVLLLLPKGVRYAAEPIAEVCGYDLFVMEDPRQECLRFRVTPPLDLGFTPKALKMGEAQHFAMERTVWRQETRYRPRERRWMARFGRKGRVGARSIPMAQRWETSLYAPKGAPVRLCRLAVNAVTADPVAAVWRCPFWRRGAPIWTSGGAR